MTDPLSIRCPTCGSLPDLRCGDGRSDKRWKDKPHRARILAAREIDRKIEARLARIQQAKDLFHVGMRQALRVKVKRNKGETARDALLRWSSDFVDIVIDELVRDLS